MNRGTRWEVKSASHPSPNASFIFFQRAGVWLGFPGRWVRSHTYIDVSAEVLGALDAVAPAAVDDVA